MFSHVLPSNLSTITSIQGAHSPHPSCIRTYHAPSLTHHRCHTLATNRHILLSSVWNRDQGISLRPTIGTLTWNGLRCNLDFLSGRSSDMLVGPALSTFKALEEGSDDKLCPLILFWTFNFPSPSVMFVACQIFYHHEGDFWCLVHIHIWWWRQSGLA